PRDRRTADGVAVLLAGRWPAEVQAAIAAGQFARVSGRVVGEFWRCIATCGLSRENGEQTANGAQDEAPVAAGDVDSDTPEAPTVPIIPDADIDTLEPGSAEFTKTVQRLEHYGARFPPWFFDQPAEEVRAGLKEAARSEKVLRAYAAEQEGIKRQRDALVSQWAIDVGVPLPDPEPAIGLEYPCTDDGNGDRLVAQYRDSIRYCKTFDAWFLWSGSRWERDETCRMLALAKRVARTIHLEASMASDDRREKVGKWALTSGMLSRLKAMIACAAPAVAVTPDEFDAHPTLLNCKNGTLELDTLTFREARREDLLTKCCGVDYDPAAECPTWLAHLDLVFGGDAAYIHGFQELCGYSLLQDNPEQIMAILYGTGKNGKSVTIGALARVWGDYAVNIAAESLMVKRSEGPRSDLARLCGARLVTASEGEAGAYLAESVVKQLTGDDAITVRRLYENEFQFRPGAKIFLATNHEPRIRGTDEGIWRRLWLLPFTVTIPEDRRDPGILDKLESEGSGILNWCLEGLRRYQENGCRLAPPAKVVAATARFRSESDVLGRFLAQEMKVDVIGTIERTALYKIYLKWCEDEGERPVSNRAVIKYLRERGFGERKLGGAMCWTGIRIKSATEAEEDATEGSLQAGL
ncbi:MAG: phage/plasmid primase, P4 family, partial [Patescibacteria group bacterium]